MIFQLTIFTFFIMFLSGSPVFACASSFSPEKDYLWLSAENGERKSDGSVILPLTINFGRFPAGNIGPALLSDLRVSYALASGDHWRTMDVRPEPARDGALLVRVRVGAEQRLVFQVTASSHEQGETVRHSAVTSYQRFGQIKPGKAASLLPMDLPESPLEIRVTPSFNYWRQTGEPLGITCRNRLNVFPCSAITILDEHLPPERVVLNTAGFATYTPPDDAILNGLEERSAKQTLLVAENGGCRATFTLPLHRNRTAHRKPLPGVLTMCAACALSVLTVLLKRRKSA